MSSFTNGSAELMHVCDRIIGKVMMKLFDRSSLLRVLTLVFI
jgi:hypothetical protein